MSFTYKIHHLDPSDPNFLFLAGKFVSLRLQALSVSGAAFSSTFEIESAFPPSLWISRLQRPNVHTFIAIAYPPSFTPEQQTIEVGDFIGSATILGPVPKIRYVLPLSNGPEVGSDDEETKWQMTAVFNNPSHRGKGVAKMLIRAALDFAAEAARPKMSRMRIIIHPKNIVVKNLYVSLGFVDAGNGTQHEALFANGDENLVPADGGMSDPEKYHSRTAIIMEKVTESKSA